MCVCARVTAPSNVLVLRQLLLSISLFLRIPSSPSSNFITINSNNNEMCEMRCNEHTKFLLSRLARHTKINNNNEKEIMNDLEFIVFRPKCKNLIWSALTSSKMLKVILLRLLVFYYCFVLLFLHTLQPGKSFNNQIQQEQINNFGTDSNNN